MRVLLVHNYYQQAGGEEQVFMAEGALLEAHGHRVVRYTSQNDRVTGMSRAALAKNTVWNQTTYRDLRTLIRKERPQVAHFHNTFPLISPAAYYAARAEGVPTVQTLHNYRLLCPNALFFREGRPCEDCVGQAVPWPGVIHACYRGSHLSSAGVAAMLTAHRAMGTWVRAVGAYITLTEYTRRKFIQGGLPAEKIVVKPNFVYPDPGPGAGRGMYALFVGRLSREKGVDTLLSAWSTLKEKIPLRIVGDGPLGPKVAAAAQRFTEVEWLGRQTRNQVLTSMKEARVLIFPSVWYEGFPTVIAEAYAAGLPVIASNLGNMSTLIDHGRTGLHFHPDDPKDLAARVEWASSHPAQLDRMREEARAEYEAKYTAKRNYELLGAIYQALLRRTEVRV
jgi:glycosyltransferase involved in cell wall biosynthesis